MGNYNPMKVYVGFDLGTTNMKALILSRDGHIITSIKERTPNVFISGVEYLDLVMVEKVIDQILDSLISRYEIAGISFTSIGESVVPVRNGKMSHLPLMWHETVTFNISQSVKDDVEKLTDYSVTGVSNDYRLSLYKILWMQKNLDLGQVDYWLPISSYFAYRLTGNPLWSESQACRSYIYDIHARNWNYKLLDYAGICDKMGDIAYTGTPVGKWRGATIGVAGHDHITGLYGVYMLNGGTGSIFYDSMGTSSILASVVKEKNKELHFREPFFSGRTGVIGAAYGDGQYYIQNSFRYFGIFLEKLSHLIGVLPDSAHCNALNSEISSLPSAVPQAIFSVGGDCILGAHRNRVNLLNCSFEISRAELMQSAYIYLCSMTRMIFESLLTYCENGPFYAGGGIVSNEIFMRYMASAINKPIWIYITKEITALGAAIAAISASKDLESLDAARKALPRRQIMPDESLSKDLAIAYKLYCDFRDSPAIAYFK